MGSIMEIAHRHGLYVVENCAQPHGAAYKGQLVGSFGDAAGFIFYPGKNIDVVSDLKGQFLDKILQACAAFIENSKNDPENLHFAIADDQNHYMGTVNLKHIHPDWAEFAIVVRKAAMGTGISKAAMKKMLDYGTQLGLSKVYWCVNKKNTRTVRFYDKNGLIKLEIISRQLKDAYA